MTITAKVITDSISEHSPRLTTLQLRYVKFIHGEFMTHRVFSRNASSSRAIPVERLIKDVMNDSAMPISWGLNQKGMQAEKECDEKISIFGVHDLSSKAAWWAARNHAIEFARAFDKAGYHKQIVNRLIEPFCHINVVVTATEWSNFFALRRHKDAQPEMRALADAIYEAMANSTPKVLNPGEWHTPYVTKEDQELANGTKFIDDLNWGQLLVKISVARCARVSYLTHEGKPPNIEDDLKLYDRLVSQIPLHASPAEHQATPDFPEVYKNSWKNQHLHGNLRGWKQFRKTLPGECQ